MGAIVRPARAFGHWCGVGEKRSIDAATGGLCARAVYVDSRLCPDHDPREDSFDGEPIHFPGDGPLSGSGAAQQTWGVWITDRKGGRWMRVVDAGGGTVGRPWQGTEQEAREHTMRRVDYQARPYPLGVSLSVAAHAASVPPLDARQAESAALHDALERDCTAMREAHNVGKIHCGEEDRCGKDVYAEDGCDCHCMTRCGPWNDHREAWKAAHPEPVPAEPDAYATGYEAGRAAALREVAGEPEPAAPPPPPVPEHLRPLSAEEIATVRATVEKDRAHDSWPWVSTSRLIATIDALQKQLEEAESCLGDD